MNFNKKAVGNSFDKNYIWISSKKKHKLIVHLDKQNYIYWFDVSKDNVSVFNSLENNITFNSLNEACSYAEEWADINICGKAVRKPRLSVENRYHLLVNAVKSVCDKYPSSDAAQELEAVLSRIGEI